MSDDNNDGHDAQAQDGGQGPGPGSGGRAPMTLKPRGQTSAGTVKQSFSHGRTKTVVVETKRPRRADAPAFGTGRPTPSAPLPAAGAAPRPSPAAGSAGPRPAGGFGASERGLSQSELEARQRALGIAREADERRQAETARQQAEEDSRRHAAEAREAAARAEQAAAAARAAEPPAPTPTPIAAAPVAAPVATAPASPVAPRPVAPAPVVATPSATPAAVTPAAVTPVAAAQPSTVRAASATTAAVEAAPAPATTPALQATPAPTPRPAPAGPVTAAPVVAAPVTAAPAEKVERPWDRLSNRNTPRPAPSSEDRPRPALRPAAPRTDGGSTYVRPTRDPGAERPAAGAGGFGARPAAAGGGAFGARSTGGAFGAGARSDATGGAFGARGPRPEGGVRPAAAGGGYGSRPAAAGGASAGGAGYGARARPEGGAAPAGGGYGARAPREGDTVRYSALNPRPASPRPGAPRPPGLRPATDDTPELTKTGRTSPPRAGERRPLGGGGDDDGDNRRKAGAAPGKAVSRTKGEPVRRQGRLTIQGVGDEDTAEKMRSLASVRRAREREREKRLGGAAADAGRSVREVVIPDAITVQDLAQRMAIRAVDVIKTLMRQGTMLKITDVLDADTAELIASEFGMEVRRVSEADVEEGFLAADDEAEGTLPRPPVVAVMGHVDHGKTSLLDALRSTDVAAGEHGGITQHIGAYQVRLPDGERVTFLDTPGHAAFSQMRARGANVTDIVILVVAADDGVMPQTIEAINHAKAAGAPIIVAINKMDKPGADPQRVINELLQHEIVIEALGGDTQAIEVSATQKTGLTELIEAILLQAEVMDLRANPDRSAEGVVIEAKLDKGRGPVATVLVKRGTLKRGDIIVAGSAYGRVRALINERGEQMGEAGPSEPVEILGLDEAPSPGEALAVVEDEARARELTDYRERVRREKQASPTGGGASLADMMARLQGKKVSELALIVKADVQGSAEAVTTSLEKLSTDEVKARILHSGAGAITESDVLLAKGSGAPILGFNVRASAQARALATREGVEIRYYAIIYDLLDDIKGVMSGMLSPELRETFLGNAEVLEVFDISKVGKIAGCRVTEGLVRKGARTRVIRNDIVIQEMGTLATLKRFKDEVNEVVVGQECGIHFAGFHDLKAGDFVECFTVETIQRTL